MWKKTICFGFVALLGLFAAIVLIGGPGWGQKAPAGVGNLSARGGPPGQRKIAPGAANAKAHALVSDFGRVPVFFVPNRGQTDKRVEFYVRGGDKTVYFAPEGVTFAMSYPARSGAKKESERWVVKLDFLGARKDVKPEGLEETGAVISYFNGKPGEWKTGLPAYSRIVYRDLWPGIDLAYKGEMDKLKYEFIVHPGADPSRIKLAYRGTERVVLTEEGRLEVKTPAAAFEDDIPVAYQDVKGTRRTVPVTYALADTEGALSLEVASGSRMTPRAVSEGPEHIYGFGVGEYDRSRTLVIDPAVFVYCGYIGGASAQGDCGRAIAVDSAGCAYIAGIANDDQSSFPVTVGPDLTYGGAGDAFVAKVDASGTGLVYCGYIGGSQNDAGLGIAVDGSGNAYVTGVTASGADTFPATVGPDLTYNGGVFDVFVAKVDPSGTGLVYCGYIGGSGEEHWSSIAVDDLGNAYVSGLTRSNETTFPVKVGPDLTYNGGDCDAFVAKVNSSGTGLVYCGYIGGSGGEVGFGIAVDSSGNAYVTGQTSSTQTTFPVKVGPILTSDGGVYVAKVNSSGTGLDYCGYIGGGAWSKIAVDGSGNAYVAASTDSTEAVFPVKVGPDLTYNGGELDVWVAKVNSSGSGLDYCGYIGGAGRDEFNGITVDNSGHAYVTGVTYSSESTFPVLNGPDLTYNGGGDAFVAEVDSSGTGLVDCGYIGGAGADSGYGIAVDSLGDVYVTGVTGSSESTFPVLVGPSLTLKGTGGNAFVAKMTDVPGPPITSLSPDSAAAGDPGFLLSVIGSEFIDGAIVRWDGSPRTTTFVSSTELDAEISAADLAAGKTVHVTVRNPDGGISNSLAFTINNPLPLLASISPTQMTGGGAAFALTVQGSNFVPNSVVRWNGSDKTTTYVSATELQAAIAAADISTGGGAQVIVFNPAPSGGITSALTVQVSNFTLGASPTSVTVTAGQSATYTIQLTPQYGSFDSPVTFNCAGLPSKCTATFSPASATPGAGSVTTTLTLTTKAASDSSSASVFGIMGFGPPTLGLFALAMTLLLLNALRGHRGWRISRRWLAACVLLCLVVLIGSCGGSGGGNNSYTGTPKGTHQISVQGTSGNMTVPTVITLVVN